MNGGCFKCGARGSCKHRAVEEPEMIREPEPEPKKQPGTTYGIGGLPRKRSSFNQSFRGKHGNPKRSEFEALTKNAFKRTEHE